MLSDSRMEQNLLLLRQILLMALLPLSSFPLGHRTTRSTSIGLLSPLNAAAIACCRLSNDVCTLDLGRLTRGLRVHLLSCSDGFVHGQPILRLVNLCMAGIGYHILSSVP